MSRAGFAARATRPRNRKGNAVGDHDKKTESAKDTEREPTIRDLDVSEKDGEQVKGGLAGSKIKQ